MKRFGDFLFVSEGELKKKESEQEQGSKKSDQENRISKAKNILAKAKVKKEKLADHNEFANDPKNEAPGVVQKQVGVAPAGEGGQSGGGGNKKYKNPTKPTTTGGLFDRNLHHPDVVVGGRHNKENKTGHYRKLEPEVKPMGPSSSGTKSGFEKYDEMVAASTSPTGGGATGKSMDQSKKKMDKDDQPHEKDSPEDKAHDVVEEGETVGDAAAEVKGSPKEMFEHLRSYREMQARGEGSKWKRSPDNAEMGKSGMPDQMLMSLKDMKKEAAKKNDPAVSGTKVESQQSGEIGNKAKAKDDLLSPLKSEPKQMIAEVVGDKYAKSAMQKSMKEGGGVEWTQNDLMKGLAFSAGAKVGATEGPNLAAKPIVKKDK